MTPTLALSLSVCVPVHGQSLDMVQACLNSVCEAIGPQDAVFVVCDGPLGFDRRLMSFSCPHQVSWIEREGTGMVASWNACLNIASGELVHIMHADDRVGRGFYAATRAALGANPDVGVVATGSGSGEGRPIMGMLAQVLTRSDTLTLLMGAKKPDAGAFVLRRSVVADARFSPRFSYCPDEEYFPRLAAASGLAYIPADLYMARSHAGQARFATWARPDFVDVYIDARMAAAYALGDRDSHYAQQETALRIVSVCAVLLEMNQRQIARRHLSRLRERLPIAGSMNHVRLMAALLKVPRGKHAVHVARILRRP